MSTISVRYFTHDVDAAVDFYAKRLGFEVEMRPGPGSAALSRQILVEDPSGNPVELFQPHAA